MNTSFADTEKQEIDINALLEYLKSNKERYPALYEWLFNSPSY